MTIDEAIEVDVTLLAAPILKDNPKVVKALGLSIEALKRLEDQRLSFRPINLDLLPGETKE